MYRYVHRKVFSKLGSFSVLVQHLVLDLVDKALMVTFLMILVIFRVSMMFVANPASTKVIVFVLSLVERNLGNHVCVIRFGSRLGVR